MQFDKLRRREFITLLGSGAATVWPIRAQAWPLAARAQQATKVPRIGFLGLGTAAAWAPRVEALRAGLRDLGYIEGKTIIIEFRWADGIEQLREHAAALVEMKVDLIFAMTSTETEAARAATTTIPIVFAAHGDPVGTDHVKSLAQPGGNIIGLSMLLTDLAIKELEILKEGIPRATRIGVLWNPTTPSNPPALRAVEAASEKLRVQVLGVPVRTEQYFENALSTMTRERVDSFLVIASPLTNWGRPSLANSH